MAADESTTASIRLAALPNIPEIVRLRWEFSSEGGRQPSETREAFSERLGAQLRDILQEPRWSIWVADDDHRPGTLIAIVCVQRVDKLARPYPRAEHWAYVTNVYVTPAQRNGGLGSRLMRRVIDASRAEGLEMLLLWPSDRAVPFYERLGFGAVVEALELPLDGPG
jgi:GNAT superfamily N-acetyltransferase